MKQDKIEKRMKESLICEFYGKMRNKQRYEMMRLFYDEDLTLQEIADLRGITRQAVHSSIQRSNEKLAGYESVLGLVSRFRNIKRQVFDIDSKIAILIKENEDDRALTERLSGLRKELLEIEKQQRN